MDERKRDGTYQCGLCREDFENRNAYAEHKLTEGHRVAQYRHWYQTNKRLLSSDKNGIRIIPRATSDNGSYDDENGIMSVNVTPGEEENVELVITNENEAPILLHKVNLLYECAAVTLDDPHGVVRGERIVRIPQGYEFCVQCRLRVQEKGVEEVPVAFMLSIEFTDKPIHIVRILQVNGVDDVALESGPTSMFRRPQPIQHTLRDFEGYVPGIPFKSDITDNLRRILPLLEYEYKESLKVIAEHKFAVKKIPLKFRSEARNMKRMLEEGLTRNTYSWWFETLLWIEEMEMETEMSYYAMKDVEVWKVSPDRYSCVECVELEVPGLAEKRPSILRGDNVFLTFENGRYRGYMGCVHQVNETSLFIAPSSEFLSNFIGTNSLTVDVEFNFSRYPLRVCHRAAILAEEYRLQDFTFPSIPRNIVQSVDDIVLNNKTLEHNLEQQEAVRNIISGSSKPAPFILFGPPGTGKTVTIVEAIVQIYKRQPRSRILICAPSNAACDNITIRLLEYVSRNHLFRMHSRSREIGDIPEAVRRVSNLAGGQFYFPSLDSLLLYRIIVCTLITASKIASTALPRNSISYVFLEECGQATEPEALVGVCGILHRTGQLVLAGDPHQLGPVIKNTMCLSDSFSFKKNGLDKSYLERLMEMEMYHPVRGNQRVVTKLLKNYRSHPKILQLPNEMFYNSELQPCADAAQVTALCDWEFLPTKNFPIVFHGVKGKNEREGNSPSYFNPQEVSVVISYVKKLLSSKVAAKDIGIITPYRQQVVKILAQLRTLAGTSEICVGSPEQFQGNEKLAIIISTVRSRTDKLDYDRKFQLGFLQNSKRFNVSVTRAKALLIIVGCPEILSMDKHWGGFLDYIKRNGGYCGKPYSPRRNNAFDESITSAFEYMELDVKN